MAGPLIVMTALLLVALIAVRSRRLRQQAPPPPITGTALFVQQLTADAESFAGTESKPNQTPG